MGFINRGVTKKDGSKTGLGKAAEKFGLGDLLEDAAGAIDSTIGGIGSSISDLTKSKKDRNNKDPENPAHFTQKEVSIANEHHDEISNILSGIGSGNLLDAGLNALNLYNFGTKWWIYTDQHVDKEVYPFRYYYYSDSKNKTDLTNSETGVPDLSVLDSIEDPTVLGYTIKVDFLNSPLFAEENKAGTRGSNIRNFISEYSRYYPELTHCKQTLNEFQEAFKLVFESMESLSDIQYKSRPYKQHYITKIEGLAKLDNPFVGISDDTDDELKISLYEDVRMFTTRMAMLYKNLTYSYNMGKKLIPANLLRFNMYIKISDQRSFTSGSNEKNRYRDAVRNGYSRIIYELRDCEMSFNGTMNDSITIGGIGGSGEGYATTSMQIKYKKVNRIFYSALFNKEMKGFITSDKFWKYEDEKSETFLKETGFDSRMRISGDPSKRKATNNNIDVVPSLRERYSNLKNGLFANDDDDSALTRFIKTQSNNAVTKGMSFVDEGLDKLRDKIDDAGLTIRERLKLAIGNKVVNLGKLHTGTNATTVLPEMRHIDNGAYIGVTQIGVEHLHEGDGLGPLAPTRNVNANELSYFNQHQIGIQHLQDAYNQSHQIGVQHLQDADAVDHTLALNDLMVGDDTKPLTAKVDLMVADPASPYVNGDDLMIPVDNGAPIQPEDLMVADDTTHLLQKEDLMIAADVLNPLDRVDLMVADAVNPALDYNDLMVANQAQAPLTLVDLMVAADASSLLQPDDLMVATDVSTILLPANLMVSDKVEQVHPTGDLMVAATVPVALSVLDLMIPVDTTSAPMETALMEADKPAGQAAPIDLMDADTYSTQEPDGDLMVGEGTVQPPLQELDNTPAPAPEPLFKKFLK